MVLELLLDVLVMLLEVLDLSWRSWTCPGGPGAPSKGPLNGAPVDVIYSASNKDETGPGASGQLQELQEMSRTIRSITRMIRSSSRTTLTGVLVGFSRV